MSAVWSRQPWCLMIPLGDSSHFPCGSFSGSSLRMISFGFRFLTKYKALRPNSDRLCWNHTSRTPQLSKFTPHFFQPNLASVGPPLDGDRLTLHPIQTAVRNMVDCPVPLIIRAVIEITASDAGA